MDESKTPRAENPENLTEPETSGPKKIAGGIPAVVSTLKLVLGSKNIFRDTKALFALNQKDGFDFPSFAWPMYLPEGAGYYQPITWDNAFNKIAESLGELESPDEAIFYTSGRTSNEAAFLYQLFVREFGTNNLPDCSNMCHESSGIALTE